jgi:hypothetical protein
MNTPIKRSEPIQGSVGCYSLDLYCDHANDAHGWEEFPHQYIGKTYGECSKTPEKTAGNCTGIPTRQHVQNALKD